MTNDDEIALLIGAGLNVRQADCALFKAKGMDSGEIGVILGIKSNTVRSYLRSSCEIFDITLPELGYHVGKLIGRALGAMPETFAAEPFVPTLGAVDRTRIDHIAARRASQAKLLENIS